MSEDQSMSDHLSKFFDTLDKLTELEIVVSEDLLTILLLYSVPNSFDNFRCAIEARDDLPSPEALKIKLLEEYNARKGQSSEQNHQGANYAKSFGNRSGQQSQETNGNNDSGSSSASNQGHKGGRRNCLITITPKKPGHKAADCRKRISDKKDSTSKAQEEEAYIEMTEAEMTSSKTWCIDSGTTSDMCHDKTLFSELHQTENQRVRLAVDRTTKIEGKGTIRLNISNGHQKRKIRLENVLFVPELKSNLFSVSKATNGGRTITFNETGQRCF